MSTLHTIDAPGAITRLMDMKIEPFLLGSTLHTVVAQRLARKICPHCKVESKLPQDFVSDIKREVSEISENYLKGLIKGFDINNLKFYKGKGCPRCGNSGYTGRMAIAEVLDINDKLQELIIDGKSILKLSEIRESQTFVTFRQDGFLKVIQGLTTMEEVLRVVAQ
jgi:type IV pilus assembly protein PilB